jgi:hypothetical protein
LPLRSDHNTQGENWHAGITMHRLRVGGGVAGFIFTVGSLLVFLIGVPAFRSFLGLAIACGIAIAFALRAKKTRPPLSLK